MWQDSAACVNADPMLFASGVTSRIIQAKTFCDNCVVREKCLQFALDNEDFETTIYGGLTGAERKELVQ